MIRRDELTDEQWALLEPLLPALPRRDLLEVLAEDLRQREQIDLSEC